jgi:hypothetical protein
MTKPRVFLAKYGIFLLIAAFLLIGNNLLLRNGFMENLLFLYYQAAGLWLPGLALARLLGVRRISRVERYALAYGAGYVLSIVMYYLFVPLGFSAYLAYAYVGVDVLSLVVLLWRRPTGAGGSRDRDDPRAMGAVLGFTTAIGLFLLFVNASAFRIPDTLAGNSFYQDLLFWIGNAESLLKSYPPVDFRTLAPDYHYHFFSSIQIAVMHLQTGVDLPRIGFDYAYLQSAVFLVLSAQALFRRVLSTSGRALVAMFLFFFTTGFENKTYMNFIHHLYIAPFGFDSGLALAMLALLCVVLQREERRLRTGLLVLTALLVASCTGTKGPVAMVLVVGLAAVCIEWIFFRREPLKGFVYGALVFSAFLAVYLLVLSGASDIYAESQTLGYLELVKPMDNFYHILRGLSLPPFLANALVIVFFPTFSQPYLYIPFGVAFLYSLIRIRTVDGIDVFCVVVSFVGIGATWYFQFLGMSQMYFMLATYPFALLFGLRGTSRMLEEITEREDPKYKGGMMKLVRYIVPVWIVLGIVSLLMYNYAKAAETYMKRGFDHAFGIRTAVPVKDPDSMTRAQYEGYVWISRNTEPDALFVSDAMLKMKTFSYIPGVFADRYIYYTKNYAEVTKLMTGNAASLAHFKALGVGYVIQSLDISPKFKLPAKSGTLVFQNSAMKVYKLS